MSDSLEAPTLDSADARLQAARAFLATVPIVDEWATQLAAQLRWPAERADRLREALRRHEQDIDAGHVSALVRHFSATEIRALTAFQASPAGRSVMKKMGGFQGDLTTALLPVLQAVVAAVAP